MWPWIREPGPSPFYDRRIEALVITGDAAERREVTGLWIDDVGAAIHLAKETTDRDVICVVVAACVVLWRLQAARLHPGTPAAIVGRLGTTISRGRGRAVVAFSPSFRYTVAALAVTDEFGRPLVRIGRPKRRGSPFHVVTVRRRYLVGWRNWGRGRNTRRSRR